MKVNLLSFMSLLVGTEACIVYLFTGAYSLWVHVSHTRSLLKVKVKANSKMLSRSYMDTETYI